MREPLARPTTAGSLLGLALLLSACAAVSNDGASDSPQGSGPSTGGLSSRLIPAGDAGSAASLSPSSITSSLALDAVHAYCHPTLDFASWINDLHPFLSQQAATVYKTVDPTNVPCTTVTGASRVAQEDPFTMQILVPTDAGEYSVFVHRQEVSSPWAVEQILPVASPAAG